jgi:subtilase family serine protease
VFASGGRAALRVSIANSGADFSGPLVVEAVMSSGNLVSSQLVFDLSLRSGRVATVDFELQGDVPERADVSIRIDPSNVIRESNEDNNSVTFTGVTTPSDPPEVLIESVSVEGTTLTIVVVNLGGALPQSEIAVRVSVGGGQATQATITSLDSEQRIQFTIQAPGTGSGTVQVLIDGATAATRGVEVGEVNEPTPSATEETATPTASTGA